MRPLPLNKRFTPAPLALAAALTVALAAGYAPMAYAQTGSAATAAPIAINIPAQPLGQALNELARQANLQMTFPAALVAGKAAVSVNGSLTVPQALARLLQGSGLEAHVDGHSVVVKPQPSTPAAEAAMLPVVTVTASADSAAHALSGSYPGGHQARGGRIGMLGNVDTMNAPFAITAFTSQTVENTQAATIADVARLDPMVRSSGMAGDNSDAFFVRGFGVGDNNIGEVAFDGLFGAGPNYRLSADYAERIEILKGPSAMVYGMSPNGAGGGAINVVPKRAHDDLTRLRADYVAQSQLGGHVDIARRFGSTREFGVRFNGSNRNGSTAIDHQARNASVGALALDYQGEKLSATLDLIQQSENIDAPSRRLWLSNGVAVPEAPDGRTNITQAWEYSKSTEQSAVLRTEYEVSDRVSLFASAAKSTSDVDRLFNTPSILNVAGDTSVRPAAGSFDVRRDTVEAGMRRRFETGAVQHRVTLQASRYQDELGRGLVNGSTYNSNIYRPIDQPVQNVALPGSAPRVSATTLSGVALSDAMSAFGEQLQFLLGLRRQQVESKNYGADGSTVASQYDQSALTPALGVVFKPMQNISLYANYVEGLSKGDTAPGTAVNAGEVFSPYRTKQHEVGVKFDQGKLMSTLSVFQITRPSGQLTNNIYAVDGEQRNQGIELSVYGQPTRTLRVHGGLTWIDAELTRTNNAATQGKTAVGVPEFQAGLNADWDTPLTGLTLTGTLMHSGKQFVDQTNSRELPSWTTLDLGARYQTLVTDKPVVWRASLRNVFDAHYWAGASTWSTLAVGAPRTLLVSATVEF